MAVGGEFRVNATVAGSQDAPAVAARPDGGFVAAWESAGQDGSGYAVETRVFAASTVAPEVYQRTVGADTLIGSIGAERLIGGGAADVFTLGRTSGDDMVDNRGHGGDGDIIAFAAGVSKDQLWFQHLGNDLKVSIIGEVSSMSVMGWYEGAINQVSAFKLADGSQLLAGQVENLVTAMAAMTPSSLGQLNLTASQHLELDPVLAANWQSH